MRIRHPGKVCERLWYLGREESGVYLLEGRDGFLMLNGGMSYIVPDLLPQFEEFGIDEGRITKLLILHSHFDHVGIVPFLKRRHPHMEVYASGRAWEILHKPKAMKTIDDFSRSVARRMEREEVYSIYDLEWQNDLTGKTVREGDRIDLGGVGVTILEIPGHSSCTLAAYVPELKALFPSDGSGVPFKGIIIPSGNSNYTQFQKNLERLNTLEVDYLCADHYGYVTGEEARDFNLRTIEAARQHRGLMEETYRSTRDIDVAAKKLTTSFFAQNPDYFLSPDIFLDVYRQMLRHIANVMEGKG
ncbi:MAG: MBL fold metallo-hydrolase [Deltaproteobacteria bacterium]